MQTVLEAKNLTKLYNGKRALNHNMHEIEKVCDRVIFLSHGKILLEGKPQDTTQ